MSITAASLKWQKEPGALITSVQCGRRKYSIIKWGENAFAFYGWRTHKRITPYYINEAELNKWLCENKAKQIETV
jgi:hypothetical protein